MRLYHYYFNVILHENDLVAKTYAQITKLASDFWPNFEKVFVKFQINFFFVGHFRPRKSKVAELCGEAENVTKTDDKN